MVNIEDIKFSLEDIIENSNNVAELMNDDERKAIAHHVRHSYELDMDSRSEWMTKYENAMKLVMQIYEKKNSPWPGAANIKYPLVLLASLQFAARAYPALVNGHTPVKAKIIGKDPQGQKAHAGRYLEMDMNYRLLEEMSSWEEDLDRMLLVLPILGCAFKKTYYDLDLGRCESKLILPKYLVLNYYTQPDKFEEARKTEIFEEFKNEIIEQMRRGIYLDLEDELEKPLGRAGQSDAKDELTSTIDGIKESGEVDLDTAYQNIEQHGWLDLDGDGYAEPYVFTVNLDHTILLRITPRFTPALIERNEKDQIVKIRAINFYTKFSFIPNPDGGIYDIGFGQLLAPINKTINTTINMLLDAGKLATMQSGFIGRGARMKNGTITIPPGKWMVTNASGSSMKDNIVPLPTKEPSGVLLNLLELMIRSGQSVGATTEIMLGNRQPTNQKATTSNIIREESMRVFTAIYRRVRRGLSKEFKKIYLLYTMFPPNLQDIIDEQVDPALVYNPDSYDIIPSADPNMAVKEQRAAMDDALLQYGERYGFVDMMKTMRKLGEDLEVSNLDELIPITEQGTSGLPPQPPSIEEKKVMAEIALKQRDQQIRLLEIILEAQDKDSQTTLKATQLLSSMEMEREKHELEKRISGGPTEGDDGGFQ